MSETIAGYTIRYVDMKDVISSDNYNNLLYATRDVALNFQRVFYAYAVSTGESGDMSAYNAYSSAVNNFLAIIARRQFPARSKMRVFAIHYDCIADMLRAMCQGMSTVLNILERWGESIPSEVRSNLVAASEIMGAYPELGKGMTIEPSHHNDLLSALSKLQLVYEHVRRIPILMAVYFCAGCTITVGTRSPNVRINWNYPWWTPEQNAQFRLGWDYVLWLEDIVPAEQSDQDFNDMVVRLKLLEDRVIFDVWHGEHLITNRFYYAGNLVATAYGWGGPKEEIRYIGTYEYPYPP